MGSGVQIDDVEAMSSVDATLPNPDIGGWRTVSGLAATVQAWSAGAPNRGWTMKNDLSDDLDFRSSESGTLAERPLLTV